MHLRKNIDPGQPAQSSQAGPSRNFVLLVKFLDVNPLPDDKFYTPN